MDIKRENVTFSKIIGILLPMIIYVGLTYLTQIVLLIGTNIVAIVTKSGLSYNDIINGFQKNLLLVTLCAAALTIPFFVFMMYRDIEKDKIKGIFTKYKMVFIPSYLLILPFSIFSMLSANYFVSFLTNFMPEFMVSSYEGTDEIIYGTSIVIQIFAAGILGPIVEEMAFRGLIYKRLKHICSYKAAAIISAALFGVFHGNWIQAPYAFIIGLLAVFLYEKYKSIVAPIIFHMTSNMFSVAMVYLASKLGESNAQTDMGASSVIMLIVLTLFTGIIAYVFGKLIYDQVKAKRA